MDEFFNVYINSKMGVGDPWDFTITWNPDILKYKWNRVSLIKIAVPKSYYVVDSSNDTTILTEDGMSTVITMPHGNYSAINYGNQF